MRPIQHEEARTDPGKGAVLADTLSKGFTAASERRATDDDMRKSEELVKDLKQSVDLGPVMSGYVLRTQFFPKNGTYMPDEKLVFARIIESISRMDPEKINVEAA